MRLRREADVHILCRWSMRASDAAFFGIDAMQQLAEVNDG